MEEESLDRTYPRNGRRGRGTKERGLVTSLEDAKRVDKTPLKTRQPSGPILVLFQMSQP